MKEMCYRFFGWLILLVIMLMSESCSGCSHRNRHARERHRDRIERRDSRNERRDRNNSRESRSQRGGNSKKYSEEQIASIAEGEDYDAMLDCEFAKLNEAKNLKKEYFQGNMPDKEAENRMKEIEEKYAPVVKALEKADNEGLLTYNQHKRQMKLLGDYIKEANSIFNRLGVDIESALDL